MARFFDLEEEGDDGASHPPEDLITQTLQAKSQPQNKGGQLATAPAATSHCSESIARAFQCYPIISSIVSSIDLNTLDSLARSCRSVHDGLIQYRNVLVTSTLHCTNEQVPLNPEELLRYRARASNWHYMEDGRNYNGKSGTCARDMAPIAALAIPRLDPELPFGSDAVQQSLCKCEKAGVWLCQPCGRSIRAADHEYRSIWRWRNQYGEVLGGLGTGIGDGDRGVICGRGEECLAAKDREQETDCDAQDARESGTAPWVNEPPVWTTTSTPSPPALGVSDSPAGSPFGPATPLGALIEEERHERTPSPQLGPGYERHEIEGIGGRVKRKLVRMVRIGACVPEWDDEKGFGGRVLESEIKGCARSWCGWCWRVIPGKKDLHVDKASSFSGCENRQCAL
ncbi:hypothetical protein MHUMG1_09177 [Metarhizium humberi]|uniref:F-box domain-containing protein n=1 Tax=Metarhizium humberi TaxID=2596975 RepID=A0A9P8M349_9HYPO|nr:hypothetical protein MHUMG1_09177 [Metarhizium humberi]